MRKQGRIGLLCALASRSGAGGFVLAVLMALGLFLHSAMAARIAPFGHSPQELASNVAPARVGHHRHHHGDSDSSALMKSCAGYCGLVGLGDEGPALPNPPHIVLRATQQDAPEPADHRPGVPPPRALA